MDIVSQIRLRAKTGLKTIALPEYADKRVIEACRIINAEGIAKALLVTPDLVNAKEKQRYIEEFCQIHKTRQITVETASQLFKNTLYYASMLVREGRVDGIVAGASHTTADIARCFIRCLGIDERMTAAVSSCFIMVVPDCAYGSNGVFVFADCGIIPEPGPRQLACIALSAAELAVKALNIVPRVAFLSYSTKGSAKGRNIDKIPEAQNLLKQMAPQILSDGELQLDAAIVPEVAKIKCPDSPIEGKANVLIFPSLEAGNIGYKLVQRLAGARAIGTLFLGLKHPASDLSRGCFVEDIVDCAAITAIRAQY